MAEIAEEKETHFQVALGDNFYITGVKNVQDKRFKETFNDIYSQNSYMNRPWHILAGNHDHYGNASAQVEYSKISDRWSFPSLYYKMSYTFSETNVLAEFIMIDTILLCGNTMDGDVGDASWIELATADHYDELPGPRDPVAAESQWAWIEEQLKNSKADYLFVAGHYPVYSISAHGPTPLLVERLQPLLHKYNVTAYFSGHDHNIQYLKHTSEGSEVAYIVSGSSSRADYSTAHASAVPEGSLQYHYPTGKNPFAQLGFTYGAFIYAELTANSAAFSVYNGRGSKKYDFTARKRYRQNEEHFHDALDTFVDDSAGVMNNVF